MLSRPISRLAGWLCPTEFDRKRAVDTSERVRLARGVVALLTGFSAILTVPRFGWLPLAFFGVQFAYLAGLDKRMARAEYPEVQAAAGMFSTGVTMTAAVVVTGGPNSPLLPLLAIPVTMIAARFRWKVVVVGAVMATASIVAVSLVMDPAGVIDDPAPPLIAILVLVGTASIAVAIQGAEVQHRQESVIDPLTSTLNRKALGSRFHEIEQQAHLSGGSVCLIELDLDHFKRVNDFLGHGRGDLVLRDMAYEVRKALRTFELLYRIGGEEFLIVLPGTPLSEAREIAERIRRLVLDCRPAGVEITVSLGVSQASGSEVLFDRLYSEADAALYEAKRRGRNQVASASEVASDPRSHEPVVG
jgi:diguanylate cyclase (GGDEF)-like protein